jgi:vacuolar iron transporter family protein
MAIEGLRKFHHSTKFSFGSTSAIITNIAIIIGLDTAVNAKFAIIGSLLVIALADNISDSLGIHVFQESEGLSKKRVWASTFTNFFSRLITSLGFILIIYIFPLNIAVFLSVLYGLLVLSVVSYVIALGRKVSPWASIFEHLLIAAVVVVVSEFFGHFIIDNFK